MKRLIVLCDGMGALLKLEPTLSLCRHMAGFHDGES